jgi:putative spermidine/putrescine transport system substrate-binding protein
MLNRRSLLLALGLMGLNQVLAGCRTSSQALLRVRLLAGAVPVQILQAFQRYSQSQGQPELAFVASDQLADSFKLLQTWKNPPSPPARLGLPTARPTPVDQLVLLGDFWLSAAIQQGLIQPLPVTTLAGWQSLTAPWQQLVQRDPQGQPSPTGEFWGAPYSWSNLVIAYNVEKFKQLGWQPQDWSDLWRPELQGHVSLPDSARLVIGLTLKKLGQSINADISAVANLPEQLKALQQQVKFYSSTAYLQPLILGDSWIAVGWSTEVQPTVERDRRIAAVVPTSGTILSADLWVRPAVSSLGSNSPASPSPATSPSPVTSPAPAASPGANSSANSSATGLQPVLQQWLEFCWRPEIAVQIAQLGSAASPVLINRERTALPAPLQSNFLLLPPADLLNRSEFLLPVKDLEAYRRLWETMRQTE